MAPNSDAMTTPGEDTELMRRVQSGDEAAFGVLMVRWERPVKSVVARLVMNTREAEDLAQETFVRVWQQREKFDARYTFRSWIFSIAVNLARNRLRWWRSRPEVALDEWTDTSGDELTAAGVVERQERASAVRDAIATLPADLRVPIVLSEYEHMSHAEIGAVVGATPKAIESRIARARERLRSMLARWNQAS
jgi:RNA polymerase sigma factor (sigma-70 family)